MTQALAGAALAAVLMAFWLAGRPRRPRHRLIAPDAGRRVAALNRERIERLRETASGRSLPLSGSYGGKDADPGSPAAIRAAGYTPGALPLPRRDRRRLLARLTAAARGETHERITAMLECVRWGDRAVLPLLLRGRHDPDPRVAALAAEGLSRFRGRPGPSLPSPDGQAAVPPARPPRNVARTR